MQSSGGPMPLRYVRCRRSASKKLLKITRKLATKTRRRVSLSLFLVTSCLCGYSSCSPVLIASEGLKNGVPPLGGGTRETLFSLCWLVRGVDGNLSCVCCRFRICIISVCYAATSYFLNIRKISWRINRFCSVFRP